MGKEAEDKTARVPDPLLEAVSTLGRSTAVLLFDSGWMVRRTDTVELISDTWVSHRTTVDVAIPLGLDAITPVRERASPQFAVPVMLLPKVRPTLMRFDFRSGTEALSLPTRHQAGLASYAALLWAARSALDMWPLPERLREELKFVALGAPEYAAPVSWHLRAPRRGAPRLPRLEEVPSLAQAEDDLVAWCQQMVGAPHTATTPSADPHTIVADTELTRLHNKLATHGLASWLLRKLATSAPLIAHMTRSPTGRQTVCLAYEENVFKSKSADVGKGMVARNGWLAYVYVIHTPYVGAGSYHFEFIAPKGVEASHSELLEQTPQDDEWAPPRAAPHDAPLAKAHKTDDIDDDIDEAGRPKYDYTPFRGEQVHRYRVEERVADALSAKLYLRASRTGFIGTATMAAVAIAGILVACAVLTRPLVSHGTGAQTMLLLIPGVLAALIARVGDHGLIIRMLKEARRTLLRSGALAFTGAAMLTLISTGKGAHAAPWHRWIFIALALMAMWQAFKLWLARTLPRSPEAHGFLERRVDWVRRRAEARAQRRARRRQRCLSLRVTARAMTWDEADRLASCNDKPERLPLAVEPARAREHAENAAVTIVPEASKRPLLLPTGRASDRFATQELVMARRLAETIRWLGDELPEGFFLEIRWAPLFSETRRALKHVRRRLGREATEPWRRLPKRHSRSDPHASHDASPDSGHG